MKRYNLTLIVPIFVFILAACASDFPTNAPEIAPAAPDASEPTAELPDAEPADQESDGATEPDPTDTVVPAAPPTDTQIPVETTEVASEDCPYSPELHATNPATVSMASGEIQLVEFFAFW
ncbi:MAG TPA: hypothetical protein VMN57_04590 [Anaerolineales bacterium]|nr:hypothetical protein [Anaerolineales bacterium]